MIAVLAERLLSVLLDHRRRDPAPQSLSKTAFECAAGDDRLVVDLRCLLREELCVPARQPGSMKRLSALADLPELHLQPEDAIACVEHGQECEDANEDDAPGAPLGEPLRDTDDDDRPDDRALGPTEPADDDHGQHEEKEVKAEHLQRCPTDVRGVEGPNGTERCAGDDEHPCPCTLDVDADGRCERLVLLVRRRGAQEETEATTVHPTEHRKRDKEDCERRDVRQHLAEPRCHHVARHDSINTEECAVELAAELIGLRDEVPAELRQAKGKKGVVQAVETPCWQ